MATHISNTALYQALNGGTSQMDMFITLLKNGDMNETEFTELLNALKLNIQSLSKRHELLVSLILSYNWYLFSDETIRLFVEVMTELFSAKTFFLMVCVQCLIKQFALKSDNIGHNLQTVQKHFSYIHCLIKAIVKIAPLAVKFINESVGLFFPYIGKSVFVLDTYIVNIVQVTNYIRDCRYQILANVIDKMLSIDVRIPRSQIEENSEDQNLQFELEVEDCSDRIKGEKNNCGSSLQVEKLDQLMYVMFTYINSYCITDGDGETRCKWKRSKSLFKDLLQIYEDVILKTQQSSHVQFVLFYTASFDTVGNIALP